MPRDRPPREGPPSKPTLTLVPLPLTDDVPKVSGRVAYQPTDRQLRLHLVAVDLVAAGKMSPVEWLSEHYTRFGERVTAAEFTKWKENGAFARWFYADLSYQPDEHDQEMMDALFLKRVQDGVAAGDRRAMEIYANIRGFRKRPAAPETGAEDAVEAAIDAWAGQGTAEGWSAIKKP